METRPGLASVVATERRRTRRSGRGNLLLDILLRPESLSCDMYSAGGHVREGSGDLKHPLLWITSVSLAAALWICFVGTMNRHELLVGVVASLATLGFTQVVCTTSRTRLELRPIDLAQCWRIPWYILSGVGDICWVLMKDILRVSPAKTLYRVCGFDSSRHDPLRAARTVLAVSYTTTAPNFIVLDVDVTQSRMLFHQIERSGVPKMTKALGAKG